jgi:hypothetical protein
VPTRLGESTARTGTVISAAHYLTVSAPVLLALAACVHEESGTTATTAKPSPPAEPPAASAVVTPPPPASQPPPAPPAAPAGPTTANAQQGPAQAPSPGGTPSAPPTASPATGTQSATTTPKVPPAAPTPVPSSAAAAATAGAALQGSASSRPPAAAVAALDLNGLEQRLRDTHAIGVFTKLSLKNQVDDLLAQFKAFHQGRSQLTLAQLRQKYEVLLLKVVSLLQDGDPALASAVSSSREALWNVLTDPKKFANI